MMIRTILVLILLASTSNVQIWSQDRSEPLISASASKTNVLIAEPFTVRVEVVVSVGSQVEFPKVIGGDESKLGVFDVLAVEALNDIPLDGPDPSLRRWTQTLTLETLRLGEHSIPSMTAIVTEEDTPRTLATESVIITVRGVLKNADEPLRDINGSIQPELSAPPNKQSWSSWWIVGMSAIAIVLFTIIGLHWLRKYQVPLRWCQRELRQLDEELHTVGEDFYTCDYLNWMKRLHNVLRTAVSTCRDGRLRSPSTQQLVAEIASIDDALSMDSCENLLQELDRVRFSKASADLRSETSFAVAFEAIRETEALLDRLARSSRKNQRGV